MAKWRNGKRGRLKPCWTINLLKGSNPFLATIHERKNMYKNLSVKCMRSESDNGATKIFNYRALKSGEFLNCRIDRLATGYRNIRSKTEYIRSKRTYMIQNDASRYIIPKGLFDEALELSYQTKKSDDQNILGPWPEPYEHEIFLFRPAGIACDTQAAKNQALFLRSYEDCNLYNTTVQNMITTHNLTDCFRSPDYVRPEVNEVTVLTDEGQIERVRVDDPWDHEEIAQQCRVGSPEEKADPVVDFFNNPNPDEDIPF